MPLVGFNKNVSLECVSASASQYTECTFAYPNAGEGNVTVAGTTPSTIVVTLNTDVPVNGGTAPWRGRRRGRWQGSSAWDCWD